MDSVVKYIKKRGCPVCGNSHFQDDKIGHLRCSSCSITNQDIKKFGLYNIKYVSDVMRTMYEFDMDYKSDVIELKSIIDNVSETYASVLNN